MKGYYENFRYEVYLVVIFLMEDSVMQKSIPTYDEMLLNFFINTIANFVNEGCFITLCTVVWWNCKSFYASSQLEKFGIVSLKFLFLSFF